MEAELECQARCKIFSLGSACTMLQHATVGSQEPVDRGGQCSVCDGADDRLLPLTVLEDEDGGDAPDAIPRGHLLVLVRVHPQTPQPAGVGLGQVCDDGVHQAAGAAPWRPERDQHRCLAPQDDLVPRLLLHISHVVGGGGAGGLAAGDAASGGGGDGASGRRPPRLRRVEAGGGGRGPV